MVHRIQNRNTGYSDFSQASTSPTFNFTNSTQNTATVGANALKVENDIVEDQNSEIDSSSILEEQDLKTQEIVLDNEKQEESLILENEYKEEDQVSNGLENFEIEESESSPELFNSENNSETDNNDQEFSSFTNKEKENEGEEDLEIPAFLRRQKN
jgi:cell division protein FtsZ